MSRIGGKTIGTPDMMSAFNSNHLSRRRCRVAPSRPEVGVLVSIAANLNLRFVDPCVAQALDAAGRGGDVEATSHCGDLLFTGAFLGARGGLFLTTIFDFFFLSAALLTTGSPSPPFKAGTQDPLILIAPFSKSSTTP